MRKAKFTVNQYAFDCAALRSKRRPQQTIDIVVQRSAARRGFHTCTLTIRSLRQTHQAGLSSSGKRGVPPDCVQTKEATRLAHSLISSSFAPCSKPIASAAVNASPAPTVSTTLVGGLGRSLRSLSARSNVAPFDPRVIAINCSPKVFMIDASSSSSLSPGPACSSRRTAGSPGVLSAG